MIPRVRNLKKTQASGSVDHASNPLACAACLYVELPRPQESLTAFEGAAERAELRLARGALIVGETGCSSTSAPPGIQVFQLDNAQTNPRDLATRPYHLASWRKCR